MRLENYYTLTQKANDLTQVEDYKTLEELLDNIDLENNDELAEYEEITITHITEYYDGSYEEKIIFSWLDDNIEIFDKEVYEALKKGNQTQISAERLSILLFNAIVYLENDFDNNEQLLKELGMTEDEYTAIMGESEDEEDEDEEDIINEEMDE